MQRLQGHRHIEGDEMIRTFMTRYFSYLSAVIVFFAVGSWMAKGSGEELIVTTVAFTGFAIVWVISAFIESMTDTIES